jgi:hypothetical protein
MGGTRGFEPLTSPFLGGTLCQIEPRAVRVDFKECTIGFQRSTTVIFCQ